MPNRAEQNMPITLKPMLKQNRACVPFVGRFDRKKITIAIYTVLHSAHLNRQRLLNIAKSRILKNRNKLSNLAVISVKSVLVCLLHFTIQLSKRPMQR